MKRLVLVLLVGMLLGCTPTDDADLISVRSATEDRLTLNEALNLIHNQAQANSLSGATDLGAVDTVTGEFVPPYLAVNATYRIGVSQVGIFLIGQGVFNNILGHSGLSHHVTEAYYEQGESPQGNLVAHCFVYTRGSSFVVVRQTVDRKREVLVMNWGNHYYVAPTLHKHVEKAVAIS